MYANVLEAAVASMADSWFDALPFTVLHLLRG